MVMLIPNIVRYLIYRKLPKRALRAKKTYTFLSYKIKNSFFKQSLMSIRLVMEGHSATSAA